MPVEFRALNPEDFLPWARADALAFSYTLADEVHELTRAGYDFSRTVGAYDGDRVVATGANLGFRMAVPGGVVPVGAVTAITVQPTDRRRGLLRQLMGWLHEDSRARGEAISVLRASEASIYSRFGYGMATWRMEYEIARRDLVLVPPPEPPRIELGRAVDLVPTLKQVWGRYWSSRPGELDRTDGWWAHRLSDHESLRDGGSERLAAVHIGSDGPDGYATYRTHHDWLAGGIPNHTVEVDAMVALAGSTRMALFSYLAGLDLAAKIELWDFPLEEPLRHRLVDPRRLRTTGLTDGLWVCLLDVAAALQARSYAAAGRLVIEVPGRGRFALDGGPDGATCLPSTESADVTLGPDQLGSLYLGGRSALTLLDAGLLDEHRPGAATAVDRMFGVRPVPHCATTF